MSTEDVTGLWSSHDSERVVREQEALLRGQMEAFQAALNGLGLDASLGPLVRTAKSLLCADPGAAFYGIREDGRSLTHLVGMPGSYASAVEGFPVGPTSFCSGLAAHTGRAVITRDIETDPSWTAFRTVAREHGFRACWSIPVQVPAGPILGTMAIYFADPREPTDREVRLMANLTHAAAIILSRHAEMIHRAEAERSLRESDRRKDEFLAILSHELRNPLAPMRNALELLRRSEGLSTSAEQWLETLSRQMVQMVRLLDDLLDVSRVSRGKLELKRQRLELGALLREAQESSRVLAEQYGQEIHVRTDGEPIHLEADPVRLLQVLGNLMNNACRYGGRGGKVQCTVSRDGDEAIIAIRDDGIGIPPDKLESIFELFAQVDRSLERSRGGLGIGLHLTRQLVEMHGGTIRARSDGPNTGSEFVIRLPITVPNVTTVPEPTGNGGTQDGKRSSQRILVVDDNVDSARSLAMLLALSGNETETSFDGDDAIEKALRDRPDVILLDIGLPRRHGYDVCRAIRDHLAEHRPIIVALSGYGTEQDRRQSAEAGFDAHVVKPVDYDNLRLVLEELVVARSNGTQVVTG